MNDDGAKRQRTSRGRGLRTRSGCGKCRARRVKCDERKPTCSACSRRGEECGYQDVDETPSRRQAEHAENQKDVRPRATGTPRPQSARSSTTTEGRNDKSPQDLPAEPVIPSPPALASIARRDTSSTAADQIAAVASQQQSWSNINVAGIIALPELQPWHQTCESDPEGWQVWAASPESSWSNPPGYTAEAASLLWFGLLASDANANIARATSGDPPEGPCMPSSETADAVLHDCVTRAAHKPDGLSSQDILRFEESITLEPGEIVLFRHFVQVLSTWLDVTDPERSFAVVVADMALQDAGLMCAILALSARHLSACSANDTSYDAVEYYSQALQYLQGAMQHAPYLTSDELLATVLVISAYEMLDTEGRDWERHLKGVFWIQRSQLIHGESEGLKRCIWWAWLRQDIWAAFSERRKILSFYVLKRACFELGFWELVNRSVFLLGQCVNYASDKETQAGASDVEGRIARGQSLWASLEEWNSCFARFDRRLPTIRVDDFPFKPVWINPSAASLAIQVYHFARLLLSDLMPAMGGLAELTKRAENVRESVAAICGIAYCTTESAAMLTSTQCLYATRPYLTTPREVDAVNELLLSHQKQTGWPGGDILVDRRSSFPVTTLSRP